MLPNMSRATKTNSFCRVWYDGEQTPAIEMPWMDFLGDVEAKTAHFSTVYFSHVKESHNFRLPMPFGKHIHIEVDNPTDKKLTGYSDIQWEKVAKLPEASGYLHVAYRTGTAHSRNRGQGLRHQGTRNHRCSLVASSGRLPADGGQQPLVRRAIKSFILMAAKSPRWNLSVRRHVWFFMGHGRRHPVGQLLCHHPQRPLEVRWAVHAAALSRKRQDQVRSPPVAGSLTTGRSSFPALSRNPRHLKTPKNSLVMPYRSAVYYYAQEIASSPARK